jgi:hypothetical protein
LRSASFFWIKQPKKNLAHDSGDGGTALFRNVSMYLPVDK